MIDFGELRSAVENCRYEDLAGIWPTIPSHYHEWLFAKLPWVKPHTFKVLRYAMEDVNHGNRERIASVVYLILAGGHREHWMRYAMANLRDVEHESTDAADLVWWMCSHAPDLHQRILDAGHTCDEDLVWEFLAQFAYWELVRPKALIEYESPACSIAAHEPMRNVLTSWPTPTLGGTGDWDSKTWGIWARSQPLVCASASDTPYRNKWKNPCYDIIEATRKAMKGDA